MKKLIRVSTKNMSREQWLNQRKNTIGGSDAAGIVGLSKWASPFSVWAEKTGRTSDKEDTEAMCQGRDLEEYVAHRWMKDTGKKVRRVLSILYNPQYPFAHADIDRFVTGENAGLECKTTMTLDIKQFAGNEFPVQYYAQCVHYMAVTGAEKWYLAVLVYGRGFFKFTLERNQDEIEALMASEENFWNMVKNDTPPNIEGSIATTEILNTLYPLSNGETTELFGRENLLKEYLQLRKQKKDMDLRIGEIENIIKADMGKTENGKCGLYNVSWKTQVRKSFQATEFSKNYPNIDLTPYYKITNVRPFKVTEKI